MNRLLRSFFIRPTIDVAKDLLGKFLVKDSFIGQINEVEAYVGSIDPACHAYRGKTKRNAVMFGKPGYSYVYFIYGMYFCFNVVTEKEGIGSAVLIRGVKPISGIDSNQKTDGPGKLCRTFNIGREHNGIDLCSNPSFYVADSGEVSKKIESSRRIGIKQATDLEWRFFADFS